MKPDDQEETFKALYAAHKRYIFAIAFNILKNSDSANDVTQEVFIKLLKQPESKVRGRELKWLVIVARNTSLKILKKNERFVAIPNCDVGLDPYTKADNSVLKKVIDNDSIICVNSPKEKMLRDEQQQLCKTNVTKAIKKLPPRLQELIKLRFFKNLSYNQIAERKKLTQGNVGFLLNKATTKLKKLLKNDRELLSEV